MVQGHHRSLYFFFAVVLIALGAHAAPAAVPYTLSSRQINQPFNGPKTIQTHNVIPVTGGSVVEDCTITLTPVVVNGENLVREVRKCTDLFVPGSPPDQSPPPPPSPPTTNTTTTTTTEPPTTTTTNSTPPPTADTTKSTETSTTTSAPDSTSAVPPSTDSSSDSTTTTNDSSSSSSSSSSTAETDTSTSTTDTAPPVATPPAGGTADSSSTPIVVLGPSTVPASATTSQVAQNQNLPSGSLANDSAPTSTGSGVAIPGKKFEVLPIGLGVFAGISVIALIVVGLVTYERTKYRKAFRQRRLAANGAEMGYGGMSERR